MMKKWEEGKDTGSLLFLLVGQSTAFVGAGGPCHSLPGSVDG